jgi:hypothetical protein
MGTAASASWLSLALRHLPAPLLTALDAWSWRVARERLDKRRRAATAAAPPDEIRYTPKPWRD